MSDWATEVWVVCINRSVQNAISERNKWRGGGVLNMCKGTVWWNVCVIVF